MSNQFNQELNLSALLAGVGIESELTSDVVINSISDSNLAQSNSICDYVKGPLPVNQDGLVLLVKERIDGYICVLVASPQAAIIELIEYVKSTVGFKRKYKHTGVHESVLLGQNVVIEDNVEIGEGTRIEHNVVIHAGTKIGKNCVIRSNASIGGEGYGFTRNESAELVHIPFIGGVVLADNVEIGYNCSIAKGVVNDTYIGKSVKLDSLVHVAHDCFIGDEATITACVAFCGYVTVGKRTRIAPNASIKQRVTIGEDVVVGVGAAVFKNIKDGEVVVGSPAKPMRQFSSAK